MRVKTIGCVVNLVALLLISAHVAAAAPTDSPDGMWLDLAGVDLQTLPAKAADRSTFVRPNEFRALWLDEQFLDQVLELAPSEIVGDRDQIAKSGATLWLPMPDGTNVEFAVVESPIMEPELAAQFPEIKTFTGRSIDGKDLYVRFDKTPFGFHALVLGGRHIYIDPLEKEGVYAAYFADEYPREDNEAGCSVTESTTIDESKGAKALTRHGETLRTFRLAVACTGEYAQFHGATSAGTIGNALAAVTTTVNRVTGIYESELAIRFTLVANNASILYWDPNTDPFDPSISVENLQAESQATINSVIQAANYDIGHTFVLANFGGAASAGVCVDANKARAVSTDPNPVGDPFNVDYVAHEIGHQFNASHTFNSTLGGCEGNREGGTAFERGSGTTIMSYAGVCKSDNILNDTSPAFHSESLRQIQDYVATLSCGTSAATGNTGPIMNAGVDHTIPKDTPFALTALGEDPEADPITFSWEERDLGPAQKIQNKDNGKSPLFRAYLPSSSPTRIFPRLNLILENKHHGQSAEWLPTKSRTMTFWVTGRDGHGGFWSDETLVTVNAGSGPFKVTYPNQTLVIKGGKKKKVKWDVAKTNLAPVNAQDVRISLSTDGGLTYPIVLAESTPNDGEQKVKFPKTGTLHARVKIEGTQNVFFDISDKDFAIDGGFNIVGEWDHSATPFYNQGRFTFTSDEKYTWCNGPTYVGSDCFYVNLPYKFIDTNNPDFDKEIWLDDGTGHFSTVWLCVLVDSDTIELYQQRSPTYFPYVGTLTRRP